MFDEEQVHANVENVIGISFISFYNAESDIDICTSRSLIVPPEERHVLDVLLGVNLLLSY